MATHAPQLLNPLNQEAHGLFNAAEHVVSISWSSFRYMGDYLHLFGVILLLGMICRNKSVAGVSKGTQFLYFLVFATRYLDLLERKQAVYLVWFKLTYIISSIVILLLFRWLETTYERKYDTVNLSVIILPCVSFAVLLADNSAPVEVLWTFSRFAEGFAMVPQYVFSYRDRATTHPLAGTLYMVSMGLYRVFYILHWTYKKLHLPFYSDYQSWLGGVIEMCFFADFLTYRFTGNSALRSAVLRVDEKINEISDKVELKVLGTSRHKVAETEGCEMRRRRKGVEDNPCLEV